MKRTNVTKLLTRFLAMALAVMMAVPTSSISALAATDPIVDEAGDETQPTDVSDSDETGDTLVTPPADNENQGDVTPEDTPEPTTEPIPDEATTSDDDAIPDETTTPDTEPTPDVAPELNTFSLDRVSTNTISIEDIRIDATGRYKYNIAIEYQRDNQSGEIYDKWTTVLYATDSYDSSRSLEEQTDNWTEIDRQDLCYYSNSNNAGTRTTSMSEVCDFDPETNSWHGYKYYYVEILEKSSDSETGEEGYISLATSKVLDASSVNYEGRVDKDCSFKGLEFWDENGNKLESLTLHEGESKLVRVALTPNEGQSIALDDNTHEVGMGIGLKEAILTADNDTPTKVHWSICRYNSETGKLEEDYYVSKDMTADSNGTAVEYHKSPLKFAFTKEYILGISNYITAETIPNDGEKYYVRFDIESGKEDYVTMYGNYSVVMPISIVSNSDNTVYEKPESPKVYSEVPSEEEQITVLRELMRTRENTHYGFIIPSALLIFMDSVCSLDEVYDSEAEREGMRPDEGDYLHWTFGERGSLGFIQNFDYKEKQFRYYGTLYKMYIYDQSMVTTDYEEQCVDEEIEKLLGEGGALHEAYVEYMKAPDAEGAKTKALKAIFDWIVANVSGTVQGQKENYYARMTPIFHTAVSALFINNGYDNKRGSGTCQAFALLFTRLTREFGIPSKLIMGEDAEAHTYNIAQFEDGWYYVDTSAGIFKQDYTTFNRATEQDYFSTSNFVKNYIYKIKGYKLDDAEIKVKVEDENGNFICGAQSFGEAWAYIRDEIDAENSEDETPKKKYVIKLLKDMAYSFSGNYDVSCDSIWLDSDDYSERLVVDLNGHSITINDMPKPAFEGQQYVAEMYWNVGELKNGSISVGKNALLEMSSNDSEVKYSNLKLLGSGDISFKGNIVVDDKSVINVRNVNAYEKLSADCKVTATNLTVSDEVTFNNAVNTTYLYTTQDSYEDVNNITFNNLVVRSGAKLCQGSNIFVTGTIRLSGRTYICNKNAINDKHDIWGSTISYTEGVTAPVNIYVVRKNDDPIGSDRVFFSGKIDLTDTLAYQKESGTMPLNIQPVVPDWASSEEAVAGYIPEKYRLGDCIATYSGISEIFLSEYSGSGDENTSSYIRHTSFNESIAKSFMSTPMLQDNYELDYYNNVLMVSSKCLKVSVADENNNITDIGVFSRWTTALTAIGTGDFTKTYYFDITDNVNISGALKLPSRAAAVVIRSGKPESEKVSLRYTGDLSFAYDITLENVDLIGQSVSSGVYSDGYRSVTSFSKNLTLDNASLMVSTLTGRTGFSLELKNGAKVDATKDITGIDCLVMQDSTLKSDSKITIKNVVSNGRSNKIIYGGNKTTNILTISGTITGNDTSDVDLSGLGYGKYARIKTNAITIEPRTITYTKDGKSITADISELTEAEKNGQHIANANIASAEWLVAGVGTDSRTIPTYKSGNMVRYGEIETGVVLFSSPVDGSYSIESIYDTLADALKRITTINNANNYYKIELQGSTDLATNSIGTTSTKSNLSFPNKARRIVITAPEAMDENDSMEASSSSPVVLYYKDNLTINSDVAFYGITLKSAAPAALNLGRYELVLNDCKFTHASGSGDIEEIKSVSGNGKAGSSKLILNNTGINLINNINNLGYLAVNDSTLEAPAVKLLAGTGMNIGTLELDYDVMVETHGATTIANIENHGGILVVPATVSKVTKNTATDKVGQISKITPMLTIEGYVQNSSLSEQENRKLILKLTQKVVRDNNTYYDSIDFSDSVPEANGRLTDSLKANGVPLAKALKVSADCIALSGDNNADEEAGLIVKTNGYIAYRKCEPNVRLSYEFVPGQWVETRFVTFNEAVTEINNLNTKSDYVIELNDNATKPAEGQAPKTFTMPKGTCVDSLTIKPLVMDENAAWGGNNATDPSTAKIYYLGGIDFTSNVILDNLDFVQYVKTKAGYLPAESVVIAPADKAYPAAIAVNAGGKSITVKNQVRFNTPVNLVGKNGSLTFDGGACLYTLTESNYGAANAIYGSIAGFSTLNITENLSVLKYRTKNNGGLTGGSLQTNYLIISGNKNPTLTVEGNLTATNTTMTTGDIVVKDVFDTVTKKFTGSKTEFTNLLISGTEFNSDAETDKITVTADRDFNIKGTLTGTTNKAKLVTRQRYNADKAKRTPFLDIKGTVLINDYGTNAGTNTGDRIEIEVRYSNECWDTDYCEAKSVGAEVGNDTAAVKLTGSPANTGMVFNTAKGTVDQFILSAANIDTANGRETARYGADHPNGYILKKVSSKVYAYFADEIKVTVVEGRGVNNGTDGNLSSVAADDILGFYPSLEDAVAAIDALKDKNAEYALIVMQDLGSEASPVALKLPSYAKAVTMVSNVAPVGDAMTYAVATPGPCKVYYNNRIDLKTPTLFRNLDMKGVAIKNKVPVATPQDIAAAGCDLTLDNILINIKSITGNGKSKLTLNSPGLDIAGNISNFAEVVIEDDSTEVNVAGSFTANKLTFCGNGTLDVKGAVTVTDIENRGRGILSVYKKDSDRKTNLTVKGFITNADNDSKLKINLTLAPVAGKFTLAETIAELSLVKDSKNTNKVILSDVKALAKMEKAAADSFTITVTESALAGSSTYTSADNLVKAGKALYICDDSIVDNNVLLNYIDEDNVSHSYKCLDMIQASKEIEAINNPGIAYEVTPAASEEITDTDLTGDNNEVSALKLPAGGKLKLLRIDMGGNALRYTGSITNTGKLVIENTLLNPVVISKGAVVAADTVISSTATNIKVNGVNESRQGLELKKVSMAGTSANSTGLITKITGTNKVTDIIIDSCDLAIKEGISNINSLTLKSANLVTGKSSDIILLILAEEDTGSSWKMLGATTIGDVVCNSDKAYVATNLGKNNKPNLTISNRVTGSSKVGVSLLTMEATLTNPACVTEYIRSNPESRTMVLRAQNLLIAKLENADRFKPFVPGSERDVSDWITYKDGQGYVKAAPVSDLRVKIDQYYDGSARTSVTYAACIYDAVKVIENMNDKNASYVINLSGDNNTGAMGVNDAVAYGSFITPSKAKLVTFRGEESANAVITYTGSLKPGCNVAFENITFNEGTYSKGIFTPKNAISLSGGSVDITFNKNCTYVKNTEYSSKYGEKAEAADLLFASMNVGSSTSDSVGVSIEGRAFSIGDVSLKNLTLNDTAELYSNDSITVSGNTNVKGGQEVAIMPGTAKKLTLNNILGKAPSVLDLYYYSEDKDYRSSKKLLYINGDIRSDEGGDALKLKLRPYLRGSEPGFKPASKDRLDYLCFEDINRPLIEAAKLAYIPYASIDTMELQYFDTSSGWRNIETGLSNSNHLVKREKALTLAYNWYSKLVRLEGYVDEACQNKVYSSEFLRLEDAINEIDALKKANNYYKLIMLTDYDDDLKVNKMPSSAKCVTFVGYTYQSNNSGSIIYTPSTRITLGCNTVFDRILFEAGKPRIIYDESNSGKDYSINLRNYSFTEINPPSGIKDSAGWTDAVTQNGRRKLVSGTRGSSYTIIYDDKTSFVQSGNYLSRPVTQFSGNTAVNMINNTELDKVVFVVSDRIQADNMKLDKVELRAKDVVIKNVTELSDSDTYVGTSGRPEFGDMKVEGSNLFSIPYSDNMVEINGTVTRDDDTSTIAIAINGGGSDGAIIDRQVIATAKKASTECFRIADSMNPSEGYAIYKKNDKLYYDASGSVAGVTLSYRNNETNFTTLDDAMSEIDSLALYKDPTAKTKVYEDYTVSVKSDFDDIADVSLNKLPIKAGILVIDGNDNIIYTGRSLSIRSNTTLQNIVLDTISYSSMVGTDISAGNYALVMDNVKLKDAEWYGDEVPLFGRISGSMKGSFTLESGEITCNSIIGFGQINLNTGTTLTVKNNASLNKLNLINKSSGAELGSNTTISVGKSFRSACIYVDTDAFGRAVLEKKRSSNVTFSGERIRVDGVYVTRSIDSVDGSTPILNIVETEGAVVGDKVLTDNYSTDSRSKLRMYRSELADSNKMSFYIDGKNIYAGK